MCGTERLLEKMKELYISYRQRYVLCLPNGRIITPKHRDGTWCSLSDNVIRNHLEHKYAIAVFAGREGSRFMCFDVDDGSKETVRLLIDRLDAMGIPRRKIHVSFSGSKGYHVELFFGGVIRTDILLNLYRHVMDACHLDQKKVEFRPTDRAAIKLPLSVHPKSGKMCWYVEAASMKEICTPDYLLGIEPLNAREQQALFSLPLLSPAKHTLRAEADGGGGARSPAETRRLGTTLAQAGTRHNMMRNIAVFERAHGSSEEACRKRLEEWYAGQDRSLIRSTPAQVYQDMDELVAWVYSERFNAAGNGCSRGAAYLYANQMEMVLAQPTRTARRQTFLLLARCRMKHERISVKSLSETIGNSTVTVRKALRKLEDAKTVTVEEEKRVRLHDGGYQAESRRYLVAHPCGDARGARMRVTMRELMLDFDRCYHEAIRTLIPQPAARQHLSAAEWQEHMSWQEGGGCIDQDSAGRTLHHPDFGELIVYEQGGRILYPACECAKKLGLANPGVAGSRCPGKELWQIKVAQRKRLHGTASYRMLGRNLIPAADVRRLASMSKDARRNEKYAWMTSLEKDGSDPQ